MGFGTAFLGGGESRTNKGIRKRVRQFAQPGYLLDILKLFSPSFMALMQPAMNQALSGARTELGRRGLTGTGFGQATLAGIPASFGMNAFAKALQQAGESQKTQVEAEAGVPKTQPRPGYFDVARGLISLGTSGGQLYDVFNQLGGGGGNQSDVLNSLYRTLGRTSGGAYGGLS